METHFKRIIPAAEVDDLIEFDRQIFPYKSDWFTRGYWMKLKSWWMIVEGRPIGCCAFEHNRDFGEDRNPVLRGSLYIASTGILPGFQGKGFGRLFKCWQLQYARRHGFHRIVTNHRKSNQPIIRLNKSFGFKIIRTSPGYYEEPDEPVVVMEHRCAPPRISLTK